MLKTIRFFCLSLFVLSLPVYANSEAPCDRLCKTRQSVAVTPVPFVLVDMNGQLDAWANLLLTINDAPTYQTYMNGYQVLSESHMGRYLARYTRRNLKGKELNHLHQQVTEGSYKTVSDALNEASTASRQTVEEYIRRLMWIRMRETRRYLIERLDTAYGLSRLTMKAQQVNHSFIGLYMVDQVEAWMFSETTPKDTDAQQAIDRWLRVDIDRSDPDLQSDSYRKAVNLLTYALKNVSDEDIRQALTFYEGAAYQQLITVIEKAMDLHFQRLVVKNNLSVPET